MSLCCVLSPVPPQSGEAPTCQYPECSEVCVVDGNGRVLTCCEVHRIREERQLMEHCGSQRDARSSRGEMFVKYKESMAVRCLGHIFYSHAHRPTPLLACHPSLVSSIQAGATPPSTAHPHPHPHLNTVSSLDVSGYVLWIETDMSMMPVGGVKPSRPVAVGQCRANTQMMGRRE